MSVEDCEAMVAGAKLDVTEAEKIVEEVKRVEVPKSWKKHKATQQAAAEDKQQPPTKEKVKEAKDIIAEGDAFAEQFPEAFQALMADGKLRSVIVAVNERRKYLK